MGWASPLAIDNFMEIIGVTDVGGDHPSFLSSRFKLPTLKNSPTTDLQE